jgi:hypothetical protein
MVLSTLEILIENTKPFARNTMILFRPKSRVITKTGMFDLKKKMQYSTNETLLN